jgi:hypothetical protein
MLTVGVPAPLFIVDRDYCATREQAMADFKARWLNLARF